MDPKRKGEIARGNSDVIFENNDYLIVRVYDAFSANYFISSEVYQSEEMFKRQFRGKEFYIIVHKSVDGESFGIINYQNSSGLPDFVFFKNGNSYNVNYEDLISKLEPIENEINNLFDSGGIYNTFKSFVGGKDVSESDLNYCDSLIHDVRIVRKSPGASRVILRIDLDEYVELFDMEEYYKEFAKNMLGGYGSWDFGSWDRSWEEYKEGYIVATFDDENKEKLKKIITYVAPEIKTDNLIATHSDIMSDVSLAIDKTYERYADKIRELWAETMEECYTQTAKESIRDDMCGVLKDMGFFMKENKCYDEYYTTVNHIISLYNGKPKNWNLTQILTSWVSSNVDINLEYISNGECYREGWDEEYYQKKISEILDDLIDEIESDEDLFANRDEYLDVYNKLTKKFKFHEWYKLPKDESKKIEFEKIDPKTNLIHYSLKSNDGWNKSKGTYDDIMLLLYHPELDL